MTMRKSGCLSMRRSAQWVVSWRQIRLIGSLWELESDRRFQIELFTLFSFFAIALAGV